MYSASSDIISVKVINCERGDYGLEFYYGSFDNSLVFINITSNEAHIIALCNFFAENCVSKYHIEDILCDYKSEPKVFIDMITH